MGVVLFLAILLGTLAFVGWPLLEPALAGDAPSARQLRGVDLQEEKERLLGAIRDLDHDHATGKIDDADHAALTARLKADAARVLKEIDTNEGRKVLRPGDPIPAPAAPATPAETDVARQLDRIAAQVNTQPPAGQEDTRFCTKCGKQARTDDAFCGRCGNKLG